MKKGFLNLGEGDINIDINAGGSGSGSGEAPDVISEEIETKEASETVEALMLSLDEQLDALDNVEATSKFIQKFKFTKPGLHLLNPNGSFHTQTGCFIPSVEEDEETGVVTDPTDEEVEEANVNIEITVEGLEERYAKIKEGVMKTITALIEAFQAFYKKMTDQASRLKASISKMAGDVKSKAAANMAKLKGQKVKMPKFTAVSTAMEKIKAAIEKCRWLRGEGEVYDVDFDKDPYISSALASIGYKIDNGRLVPDDGDDDLEVEEGTLEELGWHQAFTDKTTSLFTSTLDKVQNLTKGVNILDKIKNMFTKKPDTDKEVVHKGKLATQINELFATKIKNFGNLYNNLCTKVTGSKEESAAA